jgi:hypothetical protein
MLSIWQESLAARQNDCKAISEIERNSHVYLRMIVAATLGLILSCALTALG